MERVGDLIYRNAFEVGELYLFSDGESHAEGEGVLWGVFDTIERGCVMLESSSRDGYNFALWRSLPEEYRFCRLATRNELRDYFFNLALHEGSISAAERRNSMNFL